MRNAGAKARHERGVALRRAGHVRAHVNGRLAALGDQSRRGFDEEGVEERGACHGRERSRADVVSEGEARVAGRNAIVENDGGDVGKSLAPLRRLARIGFAR